VKIRDRFELALYVKDGALGRGALERPTSTWKSARKQQARRLG
jgi:hypothetical protein